jgi:hypothetical protein
MFEKCLNPDCDLTFDYREGRLIRFCSTKAKSPRRTPSCGAFFGSAENAQKATCSRMSAERV